MAMHILTSICITGSRVILYFVYQYILNNNWRDLYLVHIFNILTSMSFTIHNFSIQWCAQHGRLFTSTYHEFCCLVGHISVHSHPSKFIVDTVILHFSTSPSHPIHLHVWVLVEVCVHFWVFFFHPIAFPTQSALSYCQLVPTQTCVESLNRLVSYHHSNRIYTLPSMCLLQMIQEQMQTLLPANDQSSCIFNAWKCMPMIIVVVNNMVTWKMSLKWLSISELFGVQYIAILPPALNLFASFWIQWTTTPNNLHNMIDSFMPQVE